jgi:hypothetical protein
MRTQPCLSLLSLLLVLLPLLLLLLRCERAGVVWLLRRERAAAL